MIIHLASMVALLANPTAQMPVVVQCAPAPTESWANWLLQFVLSVVPVAGGVWIALWSFRATGKRDHDRWILDHKRTEWKNLLKHVSEIERAFPPGPNTSKSIDALINELQPALRELRKCRSGFLFIADVLNGEENNRKYLEFVNRLDSGERDIRAWVITRETANVRIELDAGMFQQQVKGHSELSDTFTSFAAWTLSIAQDDLGIKKAADGQNGG